MKKIVFVIALCGLFMASNAGAQSVVSNDVKSTKVEDKFYSIKMSDMPQMLRDTLNTYYEGCQVESVEVSNNTTYVKYKVILVNRDNKTYKVYLDDRCHVVKEHAFFK